MPGDIAISVRSVSKSYRLFNHPGDRIRQFLAMGLRQYHREFPALHDISFDVRRGECIGIIGRNGSGKSTLLQLICGILKPTCGSVTVNGRVSALLELGSGFNPEFTGRENIFFQGAVMGFTSLQMNMRFDSIAAFADIGEYIDQPVRTYSNGMYIRLAFAIHVFSDPDILIIDEALSVGDFFFQQKCLNFIRSLQDAGTTILFVSHDAALVGNICSRAIYLKEGKLGFVGEVREALRQYHAGKADGVRGATHSPSNGNSTASGGLEAIFRDALWTAAKNVAEVKAGKVIAVALCDAEGNPAMSYRLGSTMFVKVAYRPAIGFPTHVSIEIHNKFGQMITSTGSSRLRLTPPEPQPGALVIFEMKVYLQIEAGEYAIVVNLGRLLSPNSGENLDSTGSFGPINIHWDFVNEPVPFFGMFGLRAEGGFTVTGIEVDA